MDLIVLKKLVVMDIAELDHKPLQNAFDDLLGEVHLRVATAPSRLPVAMLFSGGDTGGELLRRSKAGVVTDKVELVDAELRAETGCW